MTMAYFNKLSWTQNWFPKFLTNYNELELSFHRIQKFLNLPNVQQNLKGKFIEEQKGFSVSVDGSFSWGYVENKNN
jgi:hypothetical protein